MPFSLSSPLLQLCAVHSHGRTTSHHLPFPIYTHPRRSSHTFKISSQQGPPDSGAHPTQPLPRSRRRGSRGGPLSWLFGLEAFRNAWRYDELGREILSIALPAVLALAADPIASLVDSAFVGHLGSAELAAVGVSISVFNLVSKLFNVPLLNVTTSFVAEEQALLQEGKINLSKRENGTGSKKLVPAISTSLALAAGIGIAEAVALFVGSGYLLNVMGVDIDSPMRVPAEEFLRLRAFGAPPLVIALAAQGTFRGFLDTKTPLYAVESKALLAGSYAKGDYTRAQEVIDRTVQIGLLSGFALASVLFIGFGPFSALFTTDPVVLAVAFSGILFVSGSQPLNALAFVFDGLYYGTSDFEYAAYSMILIGLFSSLFILMSSHFFGLAGVWSGLFLFMSLRVIAGFWRINAKGGPWKIIWSDSRCDIEDES